MLLIVFLTLLPICIVKNDSRIYLLTITALLIYLFLHKNCEQLTQNITNLSSGKLHHATIIDIPADLLEKLKNPIYLEEIQLLKYNCDLNKYITHNDYTKSTNNPWTYHSNYIDIKSLNFMPINDLVTKYNLKLNKEDENDKYIKFKINSDKCYIYSYNNNINKLKKDNWYEITIYCANLSNNNLFICPYLSTSTSDSNELQYNFLDFNYKTVSKSDKLIHLKWEINKQNGVFIINLLN